MKNIIIRITIIFILLIGIMCCKLTIPEPDFYKNLYTGELLTTIEFEKFRENLYLAKKKSTQRFKMNFVFYKIDTSSDSLIQNFKYDLRIGNEYIVNSSEAKIFELVNHKFPKRIFQTIDGDRIQLGGISPKPTVINLWSIDSPLSIAEIPTLNKIKEKYKDKVNFISITWEKKVDVLHFLKDQAFDFTHISDSKKFIEFIGSEKYPQIIFLNKQGVLQYIEDGIPVGRSGQEIESMIEELL